MTCKDLLWITLTIGAVGCGTAEPIEDGGDGDVGGDVDAGASDPDSMPATPDGCSPDALQECAYEPRDFPVNAIDGLQVVNNKFDRVSPVLVRVPLGAPEPLPVIIFSHGGSYDRDGHLKSAAWGNTMAGAGFAVVHVAHVPPATLSLFCAEVGVSDDDCNLSDFESQAIVYPTDIRTVIDSLDEIEAAAGVTFDRDAGAMVMGWSAGTNATLGAVGVVREITSTETLQVADERITAAIALSPKGRGFGGHFVDDASGETSWDGIVTPVLVMTGENDLNPGNPGLFGSIRRDAYDHLPKFRGHRLLYSLLPAGAGAGRHGTYNLADLDSPNVDVLNLSSALESAARAFADLHLRGDAAAAAYLDSSSLAILAGEGLVEVDTK